jgi:hypothetical protein
VTEPDPVAELARQVEDLQASVARYQAIVTAWNARLEREGIGGTLMLRHEVKQLAQKLDEEIAKFGAEAHREAWAETEAEIREELKKLRQKLDKAIAKHEADALPAPYWLDLSKDERAARLAELRAWVDQVGLVQYRDYFEKLPPCWSAHSSAVIELSTVMTEWRRIYAAGPDSRPLQDALVWNDKWLPGTLARLGQAIKCDMTGCRLTRSLPWERSPPPRYS